MDTRLKSVKSSGKTPCLENHERWGTRLKSV